MFASAAPMRGRLARLAFLRRPRRAEGIPRTLQVPAVYPCAVLSSTRLKGDYGFNVFHNSNPQHGGSYARHERRMRDDEVEDFLSSVKGWIPIGAGAVPEHNGNGEAEQEEAGAASSSSSLWSLRRKGGDDTVATSTSEEEERSKNQKDTPPLPSPLELGEGAIMRAFTFATFRDAYLFMGRLWAFCYGADKYPHVTWDDRRITVYLYSPSFHGLSKREARVAAFLNDQYNMMRKSKRQQRLIVDGVARNAVVEELIGDYVAKELSERHARRTAPLREVVDGTTHWSELIKKV